MFDFQNIRQKLQPYLRQFSIADLRWSYIIVAGMVVVSVLINVIFKSKGWTIWPFTAETAAVVFIQELVERNTDGMPPLQVYALALGILLVWITVAIALSLTNPIIILLGVGALIYYSLRGYMRIRRKQEMIAQRIDQGLCIHCGQPANPDSGVCENCGEDPNPSDSQLKRVQAYSSKNRNPARMRAVLKQDSLAASAKKKEDALIARRRANRPGRR